MPGRHEQSRSTPTRKTGGCKDSRGTLAPVAGLSRLKDSAPQASKLAERKVSRLEKERDALLAQQAELNSEFADLREDFLSKTQNDVTLPQEELDEFNTVVDEIVGDLADIKGKLEVCERELHAAQAV